MEIFRIDRSLRAFPAIRQVAVRHERASGFTLIEMMVVIAIAAIMMIIALPAYSQWRAQTAAKSAVDALMAHMKRARTMAISENRKVRISFQASAPYSYTLDATNSDGSKRKTIQLSQYSSRLSLKRATLTNSPNACPVTIKSDATFNIDFKSDGTAFNKTVAILGSPSGTNRITTNIIGRAYYALCP